MKAKLVPVYYHDPNHPDFVRQVSILKQLLSEEAEVMEPHALDTPFNELAETADAVLFPQMLGSAYGMADAIRDIPLPRLVITSEFGTMSMWDWEINRYLRAQGIEMISPYNLEQTKVILPRVVVEARIAPGAPAHLPRQPRTRGLPG